MEECGRHPLVGKHLPTTQDLSVVTPGGISGMYQQATWLP